MSALQRLLGLSLRACEALQPLISGLYHSQSNIATLKSDNSVLTLADGIVQYMLLDVLFKDKFASKIGEEYDSHILLAEEPYSINGIHISPEFVPLINQVKLSMANIAKDMEGIDCSQLYVFLDPIDGTREFSTNCGEQSSTCVGFSDKATGHAVAGLIYRPITSPPSWAMGIPSEGYAMNNLVIQAEPSNGFLTTNSSISPFTEELIQKLRLDRVKSGGAGNKILMLLEGRGACYIQDRGVSRWDTCAGSAILRAHGAVFSKLTKIIENNAIEDYTYSPTTVNHDIGFLDKHTEVDRAKVGPYANICGLFALSPSEAKRFSFYSECVREVAGRVKPKYF